MSERYYHSLAQLRPQLGLVVPSWFPPQHDPAEAERVLTTCLADLEVCYEPAHCLVMADGSPVAAAAAAALQPRYGHQVRALADGPHGKGGAVARGLAELLANPALRWFLVRDHDGDHFLNDTPRLVRLAEQIAAETAAASILVNGGRSDLDRPMGWIRGEYERIVNRVVWQGLHQALGQEGRALDERYLQPATEVPDFQSGYKCYSRAAAEAVVAASLAADWPMRRWGCEVLATVEVVAGGGVVGEVQRATLDQQPLTTYEGGEGRAKLHGDILLWTARRLALPAEAVSLWLERAIGRSGLRTVATGEVELLALWAYVREGLGLPPAPDGVRRGWFC